MAERQVCNDCGTVLKQYAGRWVCPSCLLRGGFAEAEDQRLEVAGPLEGGSREGASASGHRDVPIGKQFGDYELLEVIARGGMGIVYRARQKSLHRIVAVKMLLAGQFAQPKMIERFRAEAEAIAQLQHPHIVAIHEIGEQEGQPYFSMDYVEGKNLAQVSAEFGSRSAEFRRCAGWLRRMAEAVQYAHERGILHRDLKPSNVLIDAFDQPRITDFGLAKRLAGDPQDGLGHTELTLSGQVLGSPSYLPPEQAAGHRGGVESDVYALGAILYHLLTGRPPFEAESITAVLRQVLETDPLPPRLLNASIPRDLETICLKCLEKERHRRYQTARQLGEELGRFLECKPIQARPVGLAGRVGKWCRRRPALAGMGLILGLTFISGLAGVLWQWHRANRTAEAEFRQRQRAEQGEYAADILLAHNALAEGDRGHAIRLLEAHRGEASKLRNSIPGVDGAWEWRYLWDLCQGDELFTLHRYSNSIEALVLSPDRNLLAVATGERVALWELRSRRPLADLPTNAIPPLAFTATGLLATTTRDASGGLGVALWDLRSRRAVSTLACTPGVSARALSPDAKLPISSDGKLLAILGRRGIVHVVEIASGRILFEIPFSQKRSAGSVARFSPDGRRLAIGEDYGRTRLFDLRTGAATVLAPAGRALEVGRFAFSPRGDLLAVGYDQRNDNRAAVCLWDLETMEVRGESTNHAGSLNSMAFTPDAARLVSAATDWTIRIWNVIDRTEERRLWCRAGGEALVLADGGTLVSGAEDGSICFWDVFAQPRPPAQTTLRVSPSMASFAEIDTPDSRPEKPDPRFVFRLGVAFTRDSSRFITTDTNGSLVLGDTRSWRRLEALPAFGSNHWGLALSPDDDWLVTGDAEGRVTIWNWTNRKAVTNFALPFDRYGSLRFSPSGRYLMASVLHIDWTARVRLWHTGDWREISLPDHRFAGVWPVDLSPDDRLLAVGYINGAVKLFRFPSLEDEATLPPWQPIISGVLFSRDSRRLLSVNRYGSLRLWDVTTGRQETDWRSNMAMIRGAALSPDGGRLVIGGSSIRGEAIQFWDLAVRREVLALGGEKLDFVHLSFSPDGNVLAATGLSGMARLWRAPSWTEIEAIEKAKGEPRQE